MPISCDLCVVGAGYAGVNALNAAVKYLAPGARVVVVDQGVGWGGMWQHAYGFVRLHQPHRMYTAGERRWNLRKPEAHLATLTEIKSHFLDIVEACVGESEVELRTLFRHRYDAHAADAEAGVVRLTAMPVSEAALHDGGDDGGGGDAGLGPGPMPPVAIEARRLVIATGFNIRAKRPLPFSCGPATGGGVHSLTPADLLKPRWHAAMRDDGNGNGNGNARAPIWVVGSGKTAVDTVCHLERDPATRGRVRCVSGRGTWFMNRRVFAPDSLTRDGWWEIHKLSTRCDAIDAFLDMFDKWDGSNGPEVYRAMGEKGHLITPIDGATCFVAGQVDPEEVATMRAALSPAAERIARAHLLDIERADGGGDGGDGRGGGATGALRMRLRPIQGQPAPEGGIAYRNIEPGSFVVNCTDNLSPDLGFRPVVDESGLVLAPQNLLGFSGPTAHFVTHAWFLGKLSDHAWRSLPRMALHPDKENAGIRLTASVFFSSTVFARCLPRGLRSNHNFTRQPYPRWRLLGTLRRLRRTAPALWKKIKLLVPDRFDDGAASDAGNRTPQWRAVDDAVLPPPPRSQLQPARARL